MKAQALPPHSLAAAAANDTKAGCLGILNCLPGCLTCLFCNHILFVLHEKR